MVLAQEVKRQPGEYEQLFKNKGYFVILDNGAAEGERVHNADLLDAALVVSASCICLPDEVGNRGKTLRLVEDFTKHAPTILRPGYMAIPQGKGYAEIIRCATDIVNILGAPPQYWGVPRWIASELGTREPIIEALGAEIYQKGLFREPNIHLLGMSKNFDDDIACAKLPGVIGIDSANPVVAGQLGHDIMKTKQHYPRRVTEDMCIGSEWDFWDEENIHPQTILNVGAIRTAISG